MTSQKSIRSRITAERGMWCGILVDLDVLEHVIASALPDIIDEEEPPVHFVNSTTRSLNVYYQELPPGFLAGIHEALHLQEDVVPKRGETYDCWKFPISDTHTLRVHVTHGREQPCHTAIVTLKKEWCGEKLDESGYISVEYVEEEDTPS